jgi:hypothetical protein
MEENRKRYIGLDVHKHYLVALGVDADLNVVLPMRRVELSNLESWMKKNLTKQDEVVLEMTTNTWQLYDELVAYAGSVGVVHPPHVTLITLKSRTTDRHRSWRGYWRKDCWWGSGCRRRRYGNCAGWWRSGGR